MAKKRDLMAQDTSSSAKVSILNIVTYPKAYNNLCSKLAVWVCIQKVIDSSTHLHTSLLRTGTGFPGRERIEGQDRRYHGEGAALQ